MENPFDRTRILLGEEAMEKLARAKVALFGVGGVGGYAAEALIRSGVGALELIDGDRVAVTNLNRQIIATEKTVGMLKTDAAEERLKSIAPGAVITKRPVFFLPENADEFDFSSYDYVIDAVDTVTAKIEIVLRSCDAGTPVISSMGAGNKLDPAAFRVADIFKTKVCPLARVMRYELRKRGVKSLKVVYSEEEPLTPAPAPGEPGRRQTPGSVAFVPAAAGLVLASEVVKDLIR